MVCFFKIVVLANKYELPSFFIKKDMEIPINQKKKFKLFEMCLITNYFTPVTRGRRCTLET